MANFLEEPTFSINEIFFNRSPTKFLQLLRINPLKHDIETSKKKGPINFETTDVKISKPIRSTND